MNVYKQLKEEILMGDIKPGERLREEQIAARLNLSRTPVREAIRRLEAERMVVYSANKGASVRTYSYEDVRDAYNLRAQVEGYGAMLAAQNAGDDDIVRLREANLECERAAERCLVEHTSSNILLLVHANHAFHTQIADLAGNRYLKDFMTTVVSLPVAFNGFFWFSPEELKESVHQHKMLEGAIAGRDADQARAVMSTHIYHGRDHVLPNIDKIQP